MRGRWLSYAIGAGSLPSIKTSAASLINRRIEATFYREMLASGFLLHPRHMWFISAAHRQADIEATLAAARRTLTEACRAAP